MDVEEWFHNCWVPEYNGPGRPPALPRELDTLLPRLGEELARCGAKATLFVLGELARANARPLRDLVAEGHEIACHGYHHFRANDLSPSEFFSEIRDAKRLLEDLAGAEVRGYRAPEWSLRSASNPRLARVAEAGFHYDSSLVRALGAGSAGNPEIPTEYRFGDGSRILEVPPLTWAGSLRLPAGGWCGRLAHPLWIVRAVRGALAAGHLPLLVVHPWELVDRPCPGLFTGLARHLHDAGRIGFAERFRTILSSVRWESIGAVLTQREARHRHSAEERSMDTEIDGLRLAPGPIGA